MTYLKKKIDCHEDLSYYEFVPYYEGFKGTITELESSKYLVKGLYEKIGEDKIRITELLVGTWTMPYISFLESLIDGTDKNGKKIPSVIRDFTSLSTEVNVDITVVFPRGTLEKYMSQKDGNIDGVEKLLKLTTTLSTTNMHMFDSNRRLHKYGNVREIIDAYYLVRLTAYGKRKAYLVKQLDCLLVKLSNKAKYIQENLSGHVDLRRKSAQQVHDLLASRKYDIIDGDFKYLIKMPMDSVTQENVDKIMNDRDNAEKELAVLKKTSEQQMWLKELSEFETQYACYKAQRKTIQSDTQKRKATGGGASKGGGRKVPKQKK